MSWERSSELPTGLGLIVLTTLAGDRAIDEARDLIARSLESRAIVDIAII